MLIRQSFGKRSYWSDFSQISDLIVFVFICARSCLSRSDIQVSVNHAACVKEAEMFQIV